MSHSYLGVFVHYVFSTKHRQPWIDPSLEERLWPYVGGIARSNNMKALAIGGVSDHLHGLISLPSTISVADGVRLLKAGSSKWIHDEFSAYAEFNWQDGYGAFSVSPSEIDSVIAYIKNQKEHHRRKSFKEEFLEFLDKSRVEYDPRYVFC